MSARHTCNNGTGPRFGAKTPGCPRCDEILASRPAPVVRQTVHTCCPPGRGPGFRRTPGCPRCDELTAGAAPRPAHAGIDAIKNKARADADREREIRDHDCAASRCGTVCTAFQW